MKHHAAPPPRLEWSPEGLQREGKVFLLSLSKTGHKNGAEGTPGGCPRPAGRVPCGSSPDPLSRCRHCATTQSRTCFSGFISVCLFLCGSGASPSPSVWPWVMFFPVFSPFPSSETPGEGAMSPRVTPPATTLAQARDAGEASWDLA